MEILAKGSTVSLSDATVIDRLKFTAARLAEAAAKRPDYRPSADYAGELARTLWPRLAYTGDPAQLPEIEAFFGRELVIAVTGEPPPAPNDEPTVAKPTTPSTEAPTPTPDTPETPTTPETPDPEPFRFENCTVTLTVTLLPSSEPGTRRAVVGIRTHELAPSITCRSVRAESLAPDLCEAIESAIAQCRADLPLRAAETLRKTAAKSRKSAKKTKTAAQPDESLLSAV